MPMQPEYAINGSFGEVRDQNGKWLSNVTQVDGKITIDRREVKVAGTRKTGYKAMGVRGEGTIRGLKVTSEFLAMGVAYMSNDRARQFSGQLLVKLDDPEALGVERVLLKGVKFWEFPFGYQVDQIIEEEIPFTFTDSDLLDQITGNTLVQRV